MTVAFSTSSPQTSVALISPEGLVICSREVHAPMQASGACMRLLREVLEESGRSLSEATLFAADVGPGSFTGVKVAVTIAKTMAFARGVKCVGADSFDLIDPSAVVVMPSKRGEWFVRRPGAEPARFAEVPVEPILGFGPGIEPQIFPHAKNFAPFLANLGSITPEHLIPNYLIEPSISVPKNPLSPLGNQHA